MSAAPPDRDRSAYQQAKPQRAYISEWGWGILALAAIVCGWLMMVYGKPGRDDYDDLPLNIIVPSLLAGIVIRLFGGRTAGCLWVFIAPIACIIGFAFVDSTGAAYIAFLIGGIFPGAAFAGWIVGEVLADLVSAARWVFRRLRTPPPSDQ